MKNLKPLHKLTSQSAMDFSNNVNNIAYRSGIAFSIDDKISAFAFELQSAVRTIVAHKIEELSDGRKPSRISSNLHGKKMLLVEHAWSSQSS